MTTYKALLLVFFASLMIFAGCTKSTSSSSGPSISVRNTIYAQCDQIPDENSQSAGILIQKPVCLIAVAHQSNISADVLFGDLKARSPQFYSHLTPAMITAMKQKYTDISNTTLAVQAIVAELS